MNELAVTQCESSSKSSGATSVSLLAGVQARDPQAWQRLVNLYGPLVYAWCRQAGVSGMDAADVTQEIFLAVSSRLSQFRHDGPQDSFRGWLWGITRHKVGDHYRRRYGQPQAPGGTDAQRQLAELPEHLPESDADPGSASWRALECRALELIRAGSEDRTWQAFWRLVVEGQRPADVARDLDMTTAAVYEAKYRTLRRVRAELGQLG